MRLLNTALAGLRAQQAAIDAIANNVANVNTVGYKGTRVEFAEAMENQIRPRDNNATTNLSPEGRDGMGAGVVYDMMNTDFRMGRLISTERELDLAIGGDGFFAVVLPGGQSGYTRAGNMRLDGLGRLTNNEGRVLEVRIPEGVTELNVDGEGRILGVISGEERVFGKIMEEGFSGPLQTDDFGRLIDANSEVLETAYYIPLETTDISVGSDGIIRGVLAGKRENFGMLTMTMFVNQDGLIKDGENLFIKPQNPGVVGAELVGVPGTKVQGLSLGFIRAKTLELSNVELDTEMVNLIQGQRAYQMNSRFIKNGEEMWNLANSIRR